MASGIRRALPLLLAAAAGAPAARADVIVLKGGGQVDGYVTGRTAKKEVLVATASGPRKFHETAVLEVRPSADPAADFARYFGALPKRDAATAAALGGWAKERGLPDQAKSAFERALGIDPANAAAHEGLGHVRYGSDWVTPEEAERRRADEALVREMQDRYLKSMGAKPEVVLSPHWRYADYLGDGKTADRLKDMEAAWDEAVRVLGSEPFKGRGLVVACEGQEQYHLWLEKEGRPLPGFSKQFHEFAKKATGIKWTEPPILARSDLPDRAAMHAADVHSSGHVLLNNWKAVNRNQPFWIEEGFGGWMEDRVLKSNTSYCYGVSKQGYGSTFRGTKQWEVDFPDWKGLCREAAARNEFLPLDQLDMLPSGEYSRREVGQAFSLVAYLLREKGEEKFRAYVERVKNGEKSPVAFKAAFGGSFEDVEPDWKRFVQSGGW